MKRYKLISILTILLFSVCFVSCGDDNENDSNSNVIEKPNNNIKLNEWILDEGGKAHYNYSESVESMNLTVIHRIEFTLESGKCKYAIEEVHFDNDILRNKYISLNTDFYSGNTGYALRKLDKFVDHTEAEIKEALSKGDYIGSTIKEIEQTPMYSVEQLYGKWACISKVGKYTTDGYTFTDSFDFDETTNRDFYEFHTDGTITMWYNGKIYNGEIVTTGTEPETFPFSFNAYSSTNYGISVNKGKKWSRRITYLNDNRLELYEERTLFYDKGCTWVFERIN